ncbi:NAD-dependent epimerase/dehydratase family protein [Hydrogenophaga sp. BPS33]|uniref:NAD-dependent epimerase/dehydratase family protein n=1 Tax=Hydrogenophaga sp. BPS33 TaxID=2651974 RepID=UPI001356B94B|nr:NAD-dependent epimerase/dehydratase family protein [Hydrogenophaga sp. BPS33]
MNKLKVGLVGAGNIAKTHAAALRELGQTELSCVFDVNLHAAQALAREFGARHACDSLQEMNIDELDSVHVLTPPDFHLSSAEPFVRAGKKVLLEKPVGVSSAECDALREMAAASGAVIGVNQNLVFNPAYVKLKETIASGRLGKPRYLDYIYEVPLRQLAARQFGHWMFRKPLNILLEQAVHPLSQIRDLAGAVRELSVLAEEPVEISPGVGLHNACQVSLLCERMPAHMRFHVGAEFTVCRMTVVCDDGVAVADMFANQFHTVQRTAYMEPVDAWLSARATGRQVASQGFGVLRDYVLAMAKLRPRSDAFYLGMKGSLQAFYTELQAQGKPRIDLDFGAELVWVCEQMAAAFKPLPQRAVHETVPQAAPAGELVTVLGGTGFIGSYTVAALLDKGYRVRVMARGITNLQQVFSRPGVELVRGDVKNRADLERAITGAPYVINLAHGGGGPNFEAIRAAMVDSATLVAELCRAAGVQRLVHVGSIASLYLGDAGETITGDTPPDPRPETRNDYARAKALADMALLDIHRKTGFPIVLMRPGLVVGSGTSPFHGGLGFFNNDQYCVGWNDGGNALPWVLASDCASAIAHALAAPAAPGRAYNLVGDVRPSAREYLRDLSSTIGRPLQFVPSSPTGLWLAEMGKWLIKRLTGRVVPRPYKRDLVSRGLLARIDCANAKSDLAWQPVADAAEFHRQAMAVHAGKGSV